jgi:hypothetical protein
MKSVSENFTKFRLEMFKREFTFLCVFVHSDSCSFQVFGRMNGRFLCGLCSAVGIPVLPPSFTSLKEAGSGPLSSYPVLLD